jgi:hypothetical protein
MDLDEDDPAARGLRRYVGLVADAIGVGSGASLVQLDEPVGVYLPLDRRGDRDLALLWDERCGWALAVESGRGVDLAITGFLASELLPAPRVVADYVRRGCRHGDFGTRSAPVFDPTDLISRLADYAAPSWKGPRHAPIRPVPAAQPSR